MAGTEDGGRELLTADGGSFRDPTGRVYVFRDGTGEQRVVRGLTAASAATVERLLAESFFLRMRDDGDVAHTRFASPDDEVAAAVMADGWASAVEHVPVEFLTWPYEWPFSMLQDAALLQLRLLEAAVESGWMLTDATPFDIQWVGTRPVFVDIPSFAPRQDGERWRGYRQFCSMYLIPLMLTAHLGIPHQPLLRSNLAGIPPEEAAKYFHGPRLLKKGVPSHVWFPTRMESWARRHGAAAGPQSTRDLLALLDGLGRLVDGLSWSQAGPSEWSSDSEAHSYEAGDLERKTAFVEEHASARQPRLLWDLGANTGEFSRIAARHAGTVVAVDGDHEAMDALYRETIEDNQRNIIPLVMDLANPSPGQGWAGRERAPFHERRSPDMALCLALVHHLRVSANIPVPHVVAWLRSFNATVVVEFVDRDDETFVELAGNGPQDYADYTAQNFQSEVAKWFTIEDRMGLKSGKREMLLLAPKQPA